jgi:hypothetical protein
MNRTRFRGPLLLVMALTISAGACSRQEPAQATEGLRFTVGEPGPVKVRDEPDDGGRVLASLPAGTRFAVLETRITGAGQLWFRGRHDGKEGWLVETGLLPPASPLSGLSPATAAGRIAGFYRDRTLADEARFLAEGPVLIDSRLIDGAPGWSVRRWWFMDYDILFFCTAGKGRVRIADVLVFNRANPPLFAGEEAAVLQDGEPLPPDAPEANLIAERAADGSGRLQRAWVAEGRTGVFRPVDLKRHAFSLQENRH